MIDNEFITRFVTALGAGTIFWLALIWLPLIPLLMLITVVGLYMAVAELRPLLANKPLDSLWYAYLILSICSITALALLDPMRLWLITLFALVFCHDTAAYIIGRLAGRHAMCPQISPKKTWEGFFGGYGATMLIIWLLSFKVPFLASWVGLVLAVTLPAIATLGDLSVSLLKRRAGVKDAGSVLPGHGGLLDRLDSILAVSPILLILYCIYNV